MSLKELYNSIFGPDSRSRGEFLSEKEKARPVDDFEKEAQEGWNESAELKNSLNRLDQKFRTKKSSGAVSLIAFSIAVVVVISLIIKTGAVEGVEKNSKPQVSKLINITETPDITKANIEDQQSNQLLIEEVIKEQRAKKKTDGELSETKKTEKVFFEIEKLPMKKIPNSNKPELSVKRKIKEIYLHDFKLVDYSVIRKTGRIKVSKLEITGTSANKEEIGQDSPDLLDQEKQVPYISYLDKTMSHMSKGQFNEAISRFNIILYTYPEDVNTKFYLGFALYTSGDFEQSAQYFIEGLQSSITNFDEECAWYYSLCLDKLNRHGEANKIWTNISTSNSYYSLQALEKLGQ
jgi:TolA-binding protein